MTLTDASKHVVIVGSGVIGQYRSVEWEKGYESASDSSYLRSLYRTHHCPFAPRPSNQLLQGHYHVRAPPLAWSRQSISSNFRFGLGSEQLPTLFLALLILIRVSTFLHSRVLITSAMQRTKRNFNGIRSPFAWWAAWPSKLLGERMARQRTPWSGSIRLSCGQRILQNLTVGF